MPFVSRSVALPSELRHLRILSEQGEAVPASDIMER